MTTRIRTTPPFEADVKRLRKKYPDMRSELQELEQQLKNDERPGDKIPHIGYDVRKVRLPNPSAGRGKSGGFRVVYYVLQADAVLMLTIYTKTQQSDITPEQIRRIIEEYGH